MTPIKLVVLDMAGTTIRDQKEVETCFAKTCKTVGLHVSDERILALQGFSKIEVFQLLWSEVMDKNSAAYEQKVVDSYALFCQILEDHYEHAEVVPTEGCLETLAFLQSKGIAIALNTGFYRKVANIILNKLGWLEGMNGDYYNPEGLINLSLTPSEVAKGRPAPDMIYKAMEVFNIQDPKQVIKIGDTPVDLEEGYNANCLLSLAVTNGTHSEAQLKGFKNDGLLSSISELKNIILNLETAKV